MTNPAMTPPESTEPRTAALEAREGALNHMARALYDALDSHLNVRGWPNAEVLAFRRELAVKMLESAESIGYTITPTEPGRVVIDVADANLIYAQIFRDQRSDATFAAMRRFDNAITDAENAAERAATGGA